MITIDFDLRTFERSSLLLGFTAVCRLTSRFIPFLEQLLTLYIHDSLYFYLSNNKEIDLYNYCIEDEKNFIVLKKIRKRIDKYKRQMFKVHQCLEKIAQSAQQASDIVHKMCKIGQYLLVVVFYTLLTTFSYIYLTTLFQLQKDQLWQLIWFSGGLWIMFNMVFNYTMCVLVKPGTPSDFSLKEISHINYRCKRCLIIKPPRTHHCSMCGQCILQMDHHCPWIGQCVGHHNRAYFINFLTYTFFGLILVERIMNDYMQRPIYRSDIERDDVSPMLIFQMYIFVSTLIVVLGLFASFHWAIVIKGKTTLECCFDDERYVPSTVWTENLKTVFGTSNLILIFMPNISRLKNRGIFWGNIQQQGIQNTSMIEVQIANSDQISTSKQKVFKNDEVLK